MPVRNGQVVTPEMWEVFRAEIDGFYEALAAEGVSVDDINRARFDGDPSLIDARPVGYVYFLRSGLGYCKIGRAQELNSRIRTLKIQLPFPVELFHNIPTSDPATLERHFHEKYQAKRANGEWFELDESDFDEIKRFTRSPSVSERAVKAFPFLTALHKHDSIGAVGGHISRTEQGFTILVPGDGEVRELDEAAEFIGPHGQDIFDIEHRRRCDQCGSGIWHPPEATEGE